MKCFALVLKISREKRCVAHKDIPEKKVVLRTPENMYTYQISKADIFINKEIIKKKIIKKTV